MWYEGLLGLTAWQTVLATLILTQITIVSVTVYLHRHSAHNSVDLHPALAHFFRFWLWLTTGMITKEWTAVHRKHHAKCETEEDPHSPVKKGLKTVFWSGAELYKAGATEETLKRYGQRTPEDWLERNLYAPYNWIGITVMAVIDLLLFGAKGITVWAVQMMWIPFFAAGVINGIAHFFGYRNFECTDNARNISPWGFFIGGEELHNNHHTYPHSPKLSVKPWEFDIGWMWIKIFEFLRLAKAKPVGPIAHQVPGKALLDVDTLMAIANNRFQVMVQYRKKVLAPLLNERKLQLPPEERTLLQKVRKLMYREESLIHPQEHHRLQEVLAKHETLQMIYQKSKELQAIWKRQPGMQYQDKVAALREWCHQAEQSGVRHLEEFAAWLKSFSLVPAPAVAR
ncbi:acyl-CoA desaturase [Hahella sp. KA22]|uniref:DesA family fatty acid desaturase n=1 Tax=unclassified Hahella TaxID=2624107 RepID=UPI000FDF4D35|nr:MULTISPECIES: fatty acid desaturase [unclassified Hahella]AZZ90089.1 acyl-CoA desaturase [Hahella sp. KA22]MBU6954142.1 fatty acid desaturase [Hahella sp. HN01]QAY53459.1 acyl-CoA desaturase [Hahella sp. KA22]